MSSAGEYFPGGVDCDSLGTSPAEHNGKLSLGFPRGPVQSPFKCRSHHLSNVILIFFFFYNSIIKETMNKPALLTAIRTRVKMAGSKSKLTALCMRGRDSQAD